MAEDLNVVTLVGRATRDAELATTAGGTSVLKIRLAVNGRRKDDRGEWGDVPNFFDVTVWGNRADALAPYILKGKRIGVSGQLRWREWEAQDGGKRQAVEVVATSVQFLEPREGAQTGERGGEATPDFVPTSHGDDDVPF